MNWVVLDNANQFPDDGRVHCGEHVQLAQRETRRRGRRVTRPRQIKRRPWHKEEGVFAELRDDVHEWLEDNDFPYQFKYRKVGEELGWSVGFCDPEFAVAFKLRWC